MFLFLYKTYFPYILFRPVFLIGKKTYQFDEQLNILGFEKTNTGLRPFTKYRDIVKNQSTPKSHEELDVFLWLILFLHIFILGQAEYLMILKYAYLKKIPAKIKRKKLYDGVLEQYDLDLTKLLNKSIIKLKKPIYSKISQKKKCLTRVLDKKYFYRLLQM